MADAFVTLVAIQPSVSVQMENQGEADALAQLHGQGQMKQNIYAVRRKRGTTRPTQ
jgi:hypothetical protein